MSEPRYQRRKEDRPDEITQAALEVFSESGYSAARVNDVAKRAGVSKGLLYLYFKTKEDLFKSVVSKFIVPRVEALVKTVDASELSAEEFLRGPFLDFAKKIPNSPVRILIKLLLTEGSRHPGLVAFYWENVASQGVKILRKIIKRGVDNGEFRTSALEEFPQLLVSPVLLSVIWNSVFEAHHKLDAGKLIEAHVEIVLGWLKTQEEA